uniref:Uncharacterized protein n=1 Tax=Oryza glumipatula TaxID=40148 RepID=A0A0E0BEV2_9ORYZ
MEGTCTRKRDASSIFCTASAACKSINLLSNPSYPPACYYCPYPTSSSSRSSSSSSEEVFKLSLETNEGWPVCKSINGCNSSSIGIMIDASKFLQLIILLAVLPNVFSFHSYTTVGKT